MRRRSVFKFVLAVVVAVTLFPGSAVEADLNNNLNQLLRGDYAFSGESACLVSPGPFGSPPTGVPGGFTASLVPFGFPAAFPFVNSFSVHGVRTFNGDGTGTVVSRSVGFTHPSETFRLGGGFSTDTQADFTYEVFPDRTFTALSPVVNSRNLTGTRAGQTSTIVDFPRSVGMISTDLKTLTLAHDEPTVETITFSNGDVHKRICH